MSENLTRRSLLKLLGGGVLVCVMGPSFAHSGEQESGRGGQQGGNQPPREISAWVHIAADGKISVMTGKVEVGQNARTSVAAAAAEELRVPLQSINVVMGDTDLCPFDQGTFGSRTTPIMIPQIRKAAAAAREELVALAAAKLGVAVTACKADGGKVESGGKSLTYGEIAQGKKLTKAIPADIELTKPEDWKVLGKAHTKQNGRDIVTGKHKYNIDQRAEGMLYAKVLRPPSYGATIKTIDTKAAEALPNVKVVNQGAFVAVAAPTLRLANKALAEIKAEWDEKPHPASTEQYKILRGTEPGPADATTPVKIRATYQIPYIAHVPLEPRVALAEWDGKKMTVHTGTQRPFGVRNEVMEACGLTESQVRVIVPDTGSGYGGKHSGDAAVEAAKIAKAVGKPVMVAWTRPEEFMWAYFRPAGVIEAAVGTDADGMLKHWEFQNYNSGGAGLQSPYAVEGKKERTIQTESPLRQGSYRALASTFNHFARESLMDELAHELKMDPLDFRLKNLKNDRLQAVLEKAAEAFGWRALRSGTAKPAPGFGYGLACGVEKGSYIATFVEVEVKGETVRVVRATSAYECGAILNPMHLKNQVNGAILQGIGGALLEEIEYEEGRLINGKLSHYKVPRYSNIPALDTILMDRKDLPSAGAGETPIIAIAPAIANAVFSITGQRLRSLPLRPAEGT